MKRIYLVGTLATLLLVGCGGSGSRSKSTAAAANSGTNANPNTTTGGAPVSSGVTILASPVVASQARLEPDVAALTFEISASAPVELSSITVSASGTLDEASGVGELKLVGDDDGDGIVGPGDPVLATLAAPAFAVDDGQATFSFTTPIAIAAGATLKLIVAADTTAPGNAGVARIGQTLELSVSSDSDVVISSGGQPVTPGGSFPLQSGPVALQLNDHLLISEVVAAPTGSEFVEVFNPTASPIDLSNVYLTDANDSVNATPTDHYHNLPTGQNFGPTSGADFVVRFPAGTSLPPGGVVTIATDGADFMTAYGQAADFCLRDPAGGSVQMLTSDGANPPNWVSQPAGTAASIFDTGEMILLFTWDGASDLVQDLDYLFHGTANTFNVQLDKTGVMVDGPDADTTASMFQGDTAAAMQVTAPSAGSGMALQRVDFGETGETRTGGNGVTGNDETSEPTDVTFMSGAPTPGAP